MPSSCIFPGSAFSSTFCVSSFSSEALGFSAGNTHVMMVTALRISSHFSSFTLSTFAILVFSSLCLLCGLFLVCWASFFATGSRYWFLGLFSRGFNRVLGVLRVSVALLCLLWATDSSLG